MDDRWESICIKELGDIVGGATPSTSDASLWNGEIPWLTPKDLKDYRFRYITQGERCITEAGYKSCATQLMPKGSVLFSSRAPIGYVAIAENEVCTNQGFKSIVPNNLDESLFIYYLLNYHIEGIRCIGSGTTFKEVSGKTFGNYRVFVPSSKDRRLAIAKALGSFDDVIETEILLCNRLIDLMLSYYDCIIEEAGTEGLSKKKLADCGEVVGGATPSKKREDFYTSSGIAWITPKDLSTNNGLFISHGAIDITEEGYNSCSARMMPPGTVLFSSRAPIGYMAIAEGSICTNQGFKSIVPNDIYGTAFIYCLIRRNLDSIKSVASGTTFPEISGKVMKQQSVNVPDSDRIDEFRLLADPVLNEIRTLENEIDRLGRCRQLLLKSIFSGELDIDCL